MQNSDPRRVAVLTGAGGALGFHFACRLAKEGYRLALADLQMPEDTATAARELGADVYSESFDLADAQAVQAFGCHVLERFGRCDILVNNAAFMPLIPFEALTLDTFRRFQAVNVEASFLLAQHFAKDMASRGYGRIVQIASSTVGNPMPDFTGYITTKMAGIGLVRALAAELGPQGITVNAISPGLTRTAASERNLPPALFEAVRQQQLIKRNGVPADLCGLLAFVVSEEAGFMTGQVFNADGGTIF
ncbi:SDR family oxidoreductase [Pseudomonas putida]|uniref:SDR family NAD(P)-dependent oxidoreductase n=1 Tax=Pseudomonas putida TaxID=303 RepID=UPI002AC474E2|nr:SDR family oxidoreductase [Pseudomonas putida]MDZ5111368.1 SDR family NAD(P)-dependent oxidoreductase [Pseudomonas putida]